MRPAVLGKELRILLLEDVPTDSELVMHALHAAGIAFVSERVDTRESFIAALTDFKPDIVLADYKLPAFDGRAALDIVRREHPEVPVVMVSGSLGDEAVTELLKAGAKDYVLKDNLGRIGHAVQRALSEEMGIRARKAAEQALRESEEKFRSISAAAQDAIIMMDGDGAISYWNEAAERILGYTAGEALGRDLHALFVPERFRDAYQNGLRHFWMTGEGPMVGKTLELVARHKDGHEIPVDLSVGAMALKCRWNAVGILRDIRERKRTEAVLQRERDFSAAVVDTVGSLVVVIDRQGRIVSFNKACENCTGYTREDVTGRRVWDFLLLPEESSQVQAVWNVLVTTPRPGKHVNHWVARDGARRLIEWSNTVLLLPDGTLDYVIGTGLDITERRRAEQALQKMNRTLKALSACNEALIHAVDEDALLHAICRIVVETGGYRMAWVGFAENDAEKTVRPVAQHGDEAGYLEGIGIVWTDTERGHGPTGTAIRTGVASHVQNIATDPRMLPWRDKALQHGYRSSIALPIRVESGVLGALTIYADVPDFFDQEEMNLLQELADDLAFGIVGLRIRAERDRAIVERQHHQRRLRESLENTIQAIAATVEMRDPYTAGHQQRVAQLSVAIARELGLAEDRIHGLSLAATIHDLGKIQIPAEILSKPSRLSPMEFELIKAHPQVGYDIIKDVEFPWPIAQMILQHHERLDGSGYPNGLRAEHLLPESKILAVADVVEAMASYRPYRPGLGIEAALAEIGRHRGSLYDEAAVDACVHLFREKNFSLEGGK